MVGVLRSSSTVACMYGRLYVMYMHIRQHQVVPANWKNL
jgi:hypothetical protein